jgi:uncharacterized protein YcaQ
MPPSPTLDALRRYAIGRSLFPPTTLAAAIERLGFVQADPIRAPARAQDLTLRHRVRGYRAGDLERRYAKLDVHEDFFVNYGFLSASAWALMHPRAGLPAWDAATRRRARELIDFVQERGRVHPREVDAHFRHGVVTNAWGGASSATTHLLDALHYRGLLRVVRREGGIRVYAPHRHAPRPQHAPARRAQVDALVDLVVAVYAPLPATTLGPLVGRLRHAVPQHRGELAAALERAKARLGRARVDGAEWFWPTAEDPRAVDSEPSDAVRLLAPFDPVVWDRQRFERFWGWRYRFEAYTPEAERTLGYYALPVLWRERVVGWANLEVRNGRLAARFGHVERGVARDPLYRRARAAELERMKRFLRL